MPFMAVNYLITKPRSFAYRRRVPDALRERIGKREWVVSLGSTAKLSQASAARLCEQLAAKHDALIASLRAETAATGEADRIKLIEEEATRLIRASDEARDVWLEGAIDHAMRRAIDRLGSMEAVGRQYAEKEDVLADHGRPYDLAVWQAVANAGRVQPPKLNVSEAFARDRKLYGANRSDEPYRNAEASFIDAVGDLEFLAIRRPDVMAYVEAQRTLGRSEATIHRRLNCLKAVFNRLTADFDITARNPLERIPLVNARGDVIDRLPFHRSHLDVIDAYLSVGKMKPRIRQTLIIMKHTGMGPAEIGGLMPGDVFLDHETPHVWLRANELRGLKTKARDRRVPLVGDALNAMREAMDKRTTLGVFFDPPRSGKPFKLGVATDFSNSLNKHIRLAGVPKCDRLVAYSFRHTLKEAMRAAGVGERLQDRILGHAGQNGVADNYGSPSARLADMADALNKAIPLLGQVDLAIFEPHELVSPDTASRLQGAKFHERR